MEQNEDKINSASGVARVELLRGNMPTSQIRGRTHIFLTNRKNSEETIKAVQRSKSGSRAK